MTMNQILCNDCIFYRKRFPGYCAREDSVRPVRCGHERAYVWYHSDKCTHLGKHFEPKPQKALGYYAP